MRPVGRLVPVGSIPPCLGGPRQPVVNQFLALVRQSGVFPGQPDRSVNDQLGSYPARHSPARSPSRDALGAAMCEISAIRKRIVANLLGSWFAAPWRMRLPASDGGPLKRDRRFFAAGVECHLPRDAGLSTVPVSCRDPDFLSAELVRHRIPASAECGAWCNCPMGHKAPV